MGFFTAFKLPSVSFAILLMSFASLQDYGMATAIPQLSPAEGVLMEKNCEELEQVLGFNSTVIESVETIAADEVTAGDLPVGEHCLVKGVMDQRVSPVDGKSYAIGFEMRLPKSWNGRFFFQANGGTDGSVQPAYGLQGTISAISLGFAVLSSDAGHASSDGTEFGYDPEARLNYGYKATARLTPMAKALIMQSYDKKPDRSYFGGCSNGGRHSMIAATRYANEFDGILVGAPGYRLPLAAIANIAGVKEYLKVPGTTYENLSEAFTLTERKMVATHILSKCDLLDGLADSQINDYVSCQKVFNLFDHVPTCTIARDGTCLSSQQKMIIHNIHKGLKTGQGDTFYQSFPFDAGIGNQDIVFWEYLAPIFLDAYATSMVFQTPPVDLSQFPGGIFNPISYIQETSTESMVKATQEKTDTFLENSQEFMMPPSPENMKVLKKRGGKIMVYHGVSDPIFSVDDTKAWFGRLKKVTGGVGRFARFYPVPGMGHCGGGAATDQFDLLTPLVQWVEYGNAPQDVTATVNPSNLDLPLTWSRQRTRPLCPYPKVARYKGSGDPEKAESFTCQP